MALLPNGRCPKCRGPITFFDVMSIITPFQSINCVSCGELVFLRHRWGLLFLSILVGVAVVAGAVAVVLKGMASNLVAYVTALAIVVVVEFLVTGYVIVNKQLVVRRHS